MGSTIICCSSGASTGAKENYVLLQQQKTTCLSCSRSVSYTHLDVYKRQAYSVVPDIAVHQVLTARFKIPDAPDPVSYTHLDVYKRQSQHRLADPDIPERIVDTKYGGRYP